MVFSSNEFLFVYLLPTLILYFLAPPRFKNLVLLALSLVFYGWEKPSYLFLMVLVIIESYGFGLLIERAKSEKARHALMIVGISLSLLALGVFKYADFIIGALSKIPIFNTLRPLGIELPIGISFYVFQSVSYIIDVYKNTVRAQRSIVDFGAYVSMFPQLIAGPIVRYSDVERELKHRKSSVFSIHGGARRFVLGLSKKVLLADTSGALWESIRDVPRDEASVLLLWLGIVLYSFQIYFDFSGYSDMAIGLGMILGFRFPENFDYPYISKSITEFWRRWHITLSSFFREYVYFPLGGNRKGVGRTVLNLFAVWLLTGLWHGADWNFLLWGFYYFLLLVAEKIFLGKHLKRAPSLVARGYTLILVVIGWLIFYFKSSQGGFDALASYFLGMFGFLDAPFWNGEFVYTVVRNLILLIILIIGCTPIPKRIFATLTARAKGKRSETALALALDMLTVVLFALCIVYISSSDYRPNIYFEF